MSALKTFIQTRGEAIRRSFERATKRPEEAQTRLLLNILSRNQDTEYGREHGFSRIIDTRFFAQAVPVNTFSDLAPYVEKMTAGRANVLTAEPPVMFNLTSGTTDKPKLLPVTRKGRELTSRVSRLWFYRALQGHPSYLDKTVFLISGARIEGKTAGGVPYGSASGMVVGSLPQRLRREILPPAMVSEIEDYDLRYCLMARLSLAQDVSFIGTPNPTTLLRVAEIGIRHQDEIIRSTHDGTPGREMPRKIGPALMPDPSRARFLERVIRRHGELLPFACWPNLKLIGCWLGGSVGFQADKLARYYGKTPKRDIGYLASEGSVTIPHEDDTPAGILALNNNYYEFIPEDEADNSRGRLLRCHELEPGGRYRIVLTNWNGLYRYDIGDVVEVRGFYNRAPVIAFLRKSGDMLNITGEKLHVNHIMTAFARLNEELKLTVGRFRFVPDYKNQRYEILMRLPRELPREYLKNTVIPFIDKALSEANIEYNAKRRSKRLMPPCIHLMAPDWEVPAAGRRDVQHKWRMMAPEMSGTDAGYIIETIEA